MALKVKAVEKKGVLKETLTREKSNIIWFFSRLFVSLLPESINILKPLKTMKKRRLLLDVVTLLSLSAFGAEDDEQSPELVFVPDVSSDMPLDLSDGKDQHIKYFPLWNRDDQVQEYEGEWSYNLSLGYDMPLQQLFLPLPGVPQDPNEVSRVVLYELNQDGFTDALICLGSYGDNPVLYFDAYLWDEERFGGSFEYVEDFRLIPNPRIDEEHGMILGRNGNDAEIWRFDGLSKIEKVSVKQGYY